MFLLCSIIFSGSVMISELQETGCKLNAGMVLTATFQEPKQPQKCDNMDIHLHTLQLFVLIYYRE